MADEHLKNGKMESKSIYKIYMYISTLLLASVSNQNDGAVLGTAIYMYQSNPLFFQKINNLCL